jgi:acyl phosphate:glycerol-3-phosphate acyltransferase
MTSLTLSGTGTYVAAAGGAYLLGAIPCGYLVARARGVDIRLHGSGNIGATNVFRVVGKGWGILTFILDFAKGFIPACLFPWCAGVLGLPVRPDVLAVACGCLAVAGHNWPVFLHFKGGKGVATSAGALLGLAPAAVGIGLAVWLLAFALSRYVSVASILTAAAAALAAWALYFRKGDPASWLVPIALTVLAAVIIGRHHGNIRRLRQGTEHRFTFGSKKPTAETPAE